MDTTSSEHAPQYTETLVSLKKTKCLKQCTWWCEQMCNSHSFTEGFTCGTAIKPTHAFISKKNINWISALDDVDRCASHSFTEGFTCCAAVKPTHACISKKMKSLNSALDDVNRCATVIALQRGSPVPLLSNPPMHPPGLLPAGQSPTKIAAPPSCFSTGCLPGRLKDWEWG